MRQIKRPLFLGLVGFAFAYLGISLFAQASTPHQNQNGDSSPSKNEIWVEKAPGVQLAQVPRLTNTEPEFAILRLTVEKYNEFQKGPKNFLNDLKVFSKSINKLESCRASEPSKPQPVQAYWYVVVPHWPGSTAACRAYPGWSEPED